MTTPTTTRLAPALAAVAVGLVTTTAVAGLPFLRFAYESLELQVALETAQGVVALLLSYLAFGRLRLTNRLRELVLTLSFAAFAITNLFVVALPIAVEGEIVGYITWTAIGLRLLATATLAAAALVPDRTLRHRRIALRSVGGSVVMIVAVLLAAALADSMLAELVDPTLSPQASARPLFTGHPLAIGIQVASTLLMTAAAVAFGLRALRTGDDFLRWLAAGATLGAFARLNYALFPSLYTKWFYTGDLLRFGSYLLFLVGAAREIGSYWRRQAQQAVLDERRRLARELHDGLTQELSFIRSQLSTRSERGLRPEILPLVSDAADRALTESRKAVETLAGTHDSEPLSVVLRRTAAQVAAREETAVRFDIGSDVTVEPSTQLALERIVGEAVRNAARHGDATTVVVALRAGGSTVTVRVEDDGRGFDPKTVTTGRGFGLISMRERAHQLHGSLLLESTPGEGTVIEVTVPVRR